MEESNDKVKLSQLVLTFLSCVPIYEKNINCSIFVGDIPKENNLTKNDYYRKLIERFFKKYLKVYLSDNILETYTDYFFCILQQKAYNSIFGKISLFITVKEVNIDINKVDDLVKCRSKLAHGDMLAQNDLIDNHIIAMDLSQDIFPENNTKK